MEHATGRFDLGVGATRRDDGARERCVREVGHAALFSTPRIPEGFIAQPSEPQFSSSKR
jgi:hypothetical protein